MSRGQRACEATERAKMRQLSETCACENSLSLSLSYRELEGDKQGEDVAEQLVGERYEERGRGERGGGRREEES